MHPDSVLLMQAILSPAGEAEQTWRRWRREVDPDKMSADCVRLLPMLVDSSSSWLAGDPARNLILGICKRAWTRNQIQLRALCELVTALRVGGVDVSVAGPAAWAILRQAKKSFRPVSFPELLVAREKALQALHILAGSGWVPLPDSVSPEGEALDYVQGIWLQKPSGERCKLNWRLFPAPPEFAAEWEELPACETVAVQGVTLVLPRKDVLFATALTGDRSEDDPDWRCDAAFLLREYRVGWSGVVRYLRFVPDARMRLADLARETGQYIPVSVLREPEISPLRAHWEVLWRDYRFLIWRHREPHSVRGFLRYLCLRWQAPAWRLPFLGFFYTMRIALSGRSIR